MNLHWIGERGAGTVEAKIYWKPWNPIQHDPRPAGLSYDALSQHSRGLSLYEAEFISYIDLISIPREAPPISPTFEPSNSTTRTKMAVLYFFSSFFPFPFFIYVKETYLSANRKETPANCFDIWLVTCAIARYLHKPFVLLEKLKYFFYDPWYNLNIQFIHFIKCFPNVFQVTCWLIPTYQHKIKDITK